MKIMRLRVRDTLSIAFKFVGKDTKQIESEDYINNCIESNFAFMKCILGRPKKRYLEKKGNLQLL